jgi:hypothetical protein
MSVQPSRKNFLISAGTVVAGVLAYCGLRSASAPGVDRVASAGRPVVEVRREPRAVPRS